MQAELEQAKKQSEADREMLEKKVIRIETLNRDVKALEKENLAL